MNCEKCFQLKEKKIQFESLYKELLRLRKHYRYEHNVVLADVQSQIDVLQSEIIELEKHKFENSKHLEQST